MKKSIKIILIIVVLALVGGFVFWQFTKKGIVKNAVENAVSKGTDNQYYIHYDSSNIDELNGNASFYNLVLQSDSMQEKLISNDTSVAATIFNVRIQQLKISGANIPSFLQKNSIEATSIELIRPVITIIKTGKDEPIKLTGADSLALYDKITGKFNSIKAGEITITDATIAFANGKKAPSTTLQGVNVSLKNLKIDSTRNYDNIVSYFVKDIVAKVKSANIKDEKNGSVIVFEGVEYNAPGRFLKIDRAIQTSESKKTTNFDLRGSTVRGISTNDFIINKKIKADSLTTNGGEISIYRGKKAAVKTDKAGVDISNKFFDEALVKNIRIGNTTLKLYNAALPKNEPLILKNVTFNASGIETIYDGTNVKDLLSKSNWTLAANGLSLETKDHIYKIDIGPFKLDRARSNIHVNYVALKPLVSVQAFVKSLKVQKDLYNFRINNIDFKGADVGTLLSDEKLIADEASMQPLLNIFNDRTVPFDLSSKVGKYPQQQLVALDFPVYIKKINLVNGSVLYKERGLLSKQTGDVTFKKINGTITNVTNIKEKIAANNKMVLKANTKFLGVADVNTVWNLSLNSSNGVFQASGTVGNFDATKLSAITEPLGLASIKKGNIKSVKFDLDGNDLKTTGRVDMIYDNLKVALLKGASDSTETLKKKGLVSFAANLLIKDQNPGGGTTRAAKVDFDRDIAKSFFNLLWKSVFAGAKRIAMGKNDF